MEMLFKFFHLASTTITMRAHISFPSDHKRKQDTHRALKMTNTIKTVFGIFIHYMPAVALKVENWVSGALFLFTAREVSEIRGIGFALLSFSSCFVI